MEKLVFLAVVAFVAWMMLKPKRQRPTKPFAPMLDEAEARAVLGVDAAAGTDEIRAAHRRLVAAVHPDRGGSAELARRINVARDVLLKRRD